MNDLFCPSCGQNINEIDYKIKTYYIADTGIVNIVGEEVIPPEDAKFVDFYYCSCSRFIKSKFRKN